MHWGNVLRLFEEADATDFDGFTQLPVTVEIDPIDRCNHACTWCFTASQRNVASLSIELLRPLVSELREGGTRSIHLSGGGEPTLHPGLFPLRGGRNDSIVELAANAGLTVAAISNGSTLASLDHVYLVENLAWLRISLDAGTEERYASTHLPGHQTLKGIERGLQALVDARNSSPTATCVIGVSYIVDEVTPEVLSDLRLFATRMSEIGVDYVQVKPEKSAGAVFDENVDAIQTLLAESLAPPTRAMLHGTMDDRQNSDYCWYAHLGTVVGATGDVYACCFTYGQESFRLGRVTADHSFTELWQSPERSALIKRIAPRECETCRHSTVNQLVERLYLLGPGWWHHITRAVTHAESSVSEPIPRLPDAIEWIGPGLDHVRRVAQKPSRRYTDSPAHRPTTFIEPKL